MQPTEPNYPAAFVASGGEGIIEVTGHVDGLRNLVDVTVVARDTAVEGLVAPVRKAVTEWSFAALLAPDCNLSHERVTTRIRFWVEDGRGRMQVLDSGDGIWARPPDAFRGTGPAPRYPVAMIRAGREAIVYTRAEIDPSGKVVAVAGRGFTPDRDDPKPFENASAVALREWRFPAEEADAGSRFSCHEMQFRMKR